MDPKMSFSLCGVLLLLSSHAVAGINQCHTFLPADAKPIGNVRVCESTYSSLSQKYICQDYQVGKQRYRVIYRGGLVPKAIVSLNHLSQENLLWSPVFGDKKMSCPLDPPDGIPDSAVHRGIGLCQDDNDNVVPCSVYEDKVARKKEYHRYMVYYQPNGSGAKEVDAQVAGKNKHAMTAELAYQLGISLLNTTCCSEQALAYLEFAHRLFPKAAEYQTAYHQARSMLAAKEGY